MKRGFKSIIVLTVAVIVLFIISACAGEESVSEHIILKNTIPENTSYENDAVENATFEETVQNAIDSYELTVDVSHFGMSADDAMSEYLEYISATPRNFFVETEVNCIYEGNTNKAKELTISYKENKESADAKLAAFDAEVQNVMAVVNEGMSDEEKARAFHDYLIANCIYDTSYTYETAYDALVSKRGVCQAYSLAYKYLLDMVGIETTIVSSDSMDHCWNMIEIDGVDYHIDVTWDDPIVNGDNTNVTPYYDNFMKTDEEISVNHYGWD